MSLARMFLPLFLWTCSKKEKEIKTYSEGSGTDVGGKYLFEGSSRSELIAGCDLPEPHGWVVAYPPVNPIILALTGVLILVIHLHNCTRSNNKKKKKNKHLERSLLKISMKSSIIHSSLSIEEE
jgi:hypothetical protein